MVSFTERSDSRFTVPPTLEAPLVMDRILRHTLGTLNLLLRQHAFANEDV